MRSPQCVLTDVLTLWERLRSGLCHLVTDDVTTLFRASGDHTEVSHEAETVHKRDKGTTCSTSRSELKTDLSTAALLCGDSLTSEAGVSIGVQMIYLNKQTHTHMCECVCIATDCHYSARICVFNVKEKLLLCLSRDLSASYV